MPEKINHRGFPKGVDNLRADYDVPQGALRDGVNVDVLKSGRVRRRRGIQQVRADAGAHSAFAGVSFMVWATAGTLKVAPIKGNVPDIANARTVLSDGRLSDFLSFVEVNNTIYFSNSRINGKITPLGTYEPWGVAPPPAPPACSAQQPVQPDPNQPQITRVVQVTCTFLYQTIAHDGSTVLEESGAPEASSVVCGDFGFINVFGLPRSNDSRVRFVRIYATGLDGTELFQCRDVDANTGSTVIAWPFTNGKELTTQFMQPPPLGQALAYTNGRIYIGSGLNVFETRPLQYGLYDPEEDYRMFAGRVSLLAGVTDGLYVSADQTYFLPSASSADEAQRVVFPFRAIEGSLLTLPGADDDLMWLSERGLIRATTSGNAKNVSDDKVAVQFAKRAALGLVERDGHKAVIAVLTGATTPDLVHDDYIAAEVTRLAELE